MVKTTAADWYTSVRTGRSRPALVAQRIERLASDQKAGGSSPSEGTKQTHTVAPNARHRSNCGSRCLVDHPFTPNGTTQPFGGVMDGTEAVEFVDVVVAVIGYFVTYRTNLRLAQRNDRLERINRQLSEFYGPLLALTRSSDQSWQAFRKRYRP